MQIWCFSEGDAKNYLFFPFNIQNISKRLEGILVGTGIFSNLALMYITFLQTLTFAVDMLI